MSIASLQGSSYYVTFIDDFSKKSWIFKAQVESQMGKKIKVLRSDNGGEYTSNDFKDFCKHEGIKRDLTVSYNHQQNGVVERKN
jgi:transposase InsO family protein